MPVKQTALRSAYNQFIKTKKEKLMIGCARLFTFAAVVIAGLLLRQPQTQEDAVLIQPQTQTDAVLVGEEARYQTFEHGFMLQVLKDTPDPLLSNCVYVFSTETNDIVIPTDVISQHGSYCYCVPLEGLPENTVTDPPPPGLLLPIGPFGVMWGYYADVRTALGYATQPEMTYTGLIPPGSSAPMGGIEYMGIYTLPDGRAFSCGYRAATRGCGLSGP